MISCSLVRGVTLAAVFGSGMDGRSGIASGHEFSMTSKAEGVVCLFDQFGIGRTVNIMTRGAFAQKNRHVGDNSRVMDQVGVALAAQLTFAFLEQLSVSRRVSGGAIVAVVGFDGCVGERHGRSGSLVGVTVLTAVASGDSFGERDLAGGIGSRVASIARSLDKRSMRVCRHQAGFVIRVSGVTVRAGETGDVLSFVRDRDWLAVQFVAGLAEFGGRCFEQTFLRAVMS